MAAVFMAGCGKAEVINNAYDITDNVYNEKEVTTNFFSKDLCVIDNENIGVSDVSSSYAEGAGVFNVDQCQVKYAQNLYEKLYPASTTKVLTAYIILSENDLNDMVTISEDAANPGVGSSVCGLKAGDTISVKDLLYGLLIVSGNDAAIALAEYNAGDVNTFANKMNKVAQSLGATNSHFVNPSGYPDENHYTTIYDMYLIFSKAISNDTFVNILNTKTYDASYKSADGTVASQVWTNTCLYFTGEAEVPEGYSIVGGKTGTTSSAGYCLVLLSTNKNNEKVISIVYKATDRTGLYKYMNEILTYSSK